MVTKRHNYALTVVFGVVAAAVSGLVWAQQNEMDSRNMSEGHPNISILAQFDPSNVSGAESVFAEDAIFHFYNPHLPDLHGDYVGRDGVQSFFEKLRKTTGRPFEPNVVSINAVGDELVVVHRKQAIDMGGNPIESDVVVVWRIVDGQIAEVWDIPSIHTARVLNEPLE